MNSFLFAVLFLSTLSYLFHFQYRLRYNIYLSIFCFLISVMLLSICNLTNIHIYLTIIIGAIYINLIYIGPIQKKGKDLLFYIITISISSLSANALTTTFISTTDSIFPVYTVVCAIFQMYLIIAYKMILKANQHMQLPSYSYFIVFLPIGSLLLIYLSCRNFYVSVESIFFIIVLLILGIAGEYLYIFTLEELHKQHTKTLQRYMETSSQNKYNLLNQQYQNSFNLLHELMHKCNELVFFMKAKEYDKVEKELSVITDATFKEFNDIYSNSVVFNTLLQNRKELLHKHGISIKSTIEFNNFDFISFSNQVDLFNTLLDFILEEAIQSKDNKLIFIKSNVIASQVVLSFRFANNQNKNLQSEMQAALASILKNYEAILSINDIDETTTSLLLLFPKH